MFLYNENFKDWKDYLIHYFKFYKKFRVHKFANGVSHKWYLYGTPNYGRFLSLEKYVNAREIFPDEIVIDIDTDKKVSRTVKKNDALILTRIVTGRLKRLNLTYAAWDSGGDGYHIHLKFPEITTLSKIDLERAWFKENILNYLTKDVDRKYISSKICKVKKTLISLELSPHRKTNNLKTIHEYYDSNSLNKIPQLILNRFNEIKQRKTFRAFKKYTPEEKERFKSMTENGIPGCIKFFLERDIKDGRHRVMFILTNFFKKRMSEPDLTEYIKKWNRYVHNGHLTNSEIIDNIKYHYDRRGRTPGPRFYKKVLDDIGYKYVYENCEHCKLVLNSSNEKLIK